MNIALTLILVFIVVLQQFKISRLQESLKYQIKKANRLLLELNEYKDKENEKG